MLLPYFRCLVAMLLGTEVFLPPRDVGHRDSSRTLIGGKLGLHMRLARCNLGCFIHSKTMVKTMVNSIHGEFESCEFIESIVKRLLESPWCRTWRSIWIHGKSQFTLWCSSIHWVATYLNGWLKISRTPPLSSARNCWPARKSDGLRGYGEI